jgi:hypothetical protein
MPKSYRLLCVSGAAAVCLLGAAAAAPKDGKPAHSDFFRRFDTQYMVAVCLSPSKSIRSKCGTGARELSFRWKGQKSFEDHKIFHVEGDLSDKEVAGILAALRAALMKRARASKGLRAQEPRDGIADRPMRLLQPGLIPPETPVIASRVQGFYFTYREGKVEGAVDVLAIPVVVGKKREWRVLGTVHEMAR